jgi:hypothetical protein
MLAGDADRERTVHVLKDAFTEGRLTLEEYTDRVGQAYQARTYGELDLLTGDVPRPRPPAPPVPLVPYPVQPPVRVGTNGMAIASLVCSLVGCGVGSAVGVGLGHAAKRQIQRTGESGDGLATAGLVLGYLGIAAIGLLILVGVFG